MNASAFDSAVFRDIFSTEAMRRIFSDKSRVQHYLDIEAALARVQGRLGVIPAHAAEEICRHCDAGAYDMTLLKNQTERIGYPVLPVVSSLSGYVGTGLGSGAIGAPQPRTSPIRRPSCRSATRWCWSSRTCTRSPSRLRASPRNTAPRRWPGEATSSRPRRSPSVQDAPFC